MIPKKGKVFPNRDDRGHSDIDYATAIAAALRDDLGGTHQATKTVMRWTGASERTVKNWFSSVIRMQCSRLSCSWPAGSRQWLPKS
jgi:hypothetical protein